MKKLVTRTIAGIVYIALIVAALLCGDVWFMLLLAILALLGLAETESMARHLTRMPFVAMGVDRVTAVVIVIVNMLMAQGFSYVGGSSFDPVLTAMPVVLCLLVRGIVQLYLRDCNGLLCVSVSGATLLYVAGSLSTLPYIYYIAGSPLLILAMFVMIWLNDTGAFVVGSLMGRHKLFERLSPKKSWEGFFGGLAFCVAAAWLIWQFLPAWLPGLGLWTSLGLGALVAVMATWGDLFESLLKRTAEVKDSGHLIPGHGGIMDRIDSLLFVAPATLIYLMCVAKF
ncbi:MAG: phosphatidate cytidylyltransferase [Candidatus Amulumruptor caecigallinarius]|nr:phosphatidate cytidylyltransferase [Candidatus Amulumruptor caecigallinarius]MCM1396303.1 phosphatidate cytidylyltransferase [Candidatus Amulumruptor caecigallinarius]MCM1454297.1 phosphatidate cytidylyltransferase [bacterium]